MVCAGHKQFFNIIFLPGAAALGTTATAALLAVGSIFAAGFVVLTLPLGLLFGWLGKRYAVVR